MILSAPLLILVALAQAPPAEKSWEPHARTREYPWMSTAQWQDLHRQFLERGKRGDIDLLFLGDSITQGWGDNAVWRERYAGRKAANFGIGGDTTQNVLWRVENGELDGIAPKVVVLLIGTNNFGLHDATPEDAAKGVEAVVAAIRRKLPKTRVLLLGLFPRDEKPDTDFRGRIARTNEILAKLDDGRSVRFLDLGPKFLKPDGTLPKEIMPDFLHLSDEGYRIWADAMGPLLKEMLDAR